MNNPLPRWWVWVFYATIVWGIGYTVAYPAWPLITGATPGLLGASTRADVAAEIAAVDAANAAIKDKLVAADLTAIGADPELATYAENGRGRRSSGPTALPATAPAPPGSRARAIRTFWTTTGSGAARWRISI